MNKLVKLIQERCPNGVEVVELNVIANYAKNRIDASCVDENNYVGVENLLQNKRGKVKASSVPTIGTVIEFHRGDVLIGNIRPYLKKIWLADCDGGTNGDVLAIQIKDRRMMPEFLYYVLSSDQFFLYDMQNSKGAKMPRGNKEAVMKYKIPVPPLEVQREIVHVLDSFTLLTAELTAELTARKKQYSFYRDQLLKFETGVRIVPIKEVIKHSCSGATPAKGNSDYYDGGTIPWIRTQDVCFNEITNVNSFITEKAVKETAVKWIPENCVIVAISGATAGRCAINKIKATTNQHCLNMEIDKEKALYKYVYYCLCSKQDELISKKQGARGDLNASLIMSTEIPVPNLDIQKRIVKVLDNFDAICTNLNIGLPAEIKARQKQYEYYRDLLLTFAESGSMLVTDRQTDRQTELNAIRLIQYVFGYAVLPLRKVANVFRGEYITKKSTTKGDIPVILGGQEPAYYINKYNHDGEIVVIARSGVSAGFVSYWNRKIYVTDGFGYEGRNELVTTKYLYYVLKNMEPALNAMKRGAGVPHVSGETLSNVLLLIPALQEQNKIVNILDRFDTLCNDLSEGLPAEIEARRKQYEYYRDKLLSFEELQKK